MFLDSIDSRSGSRVCVYLIVIRSLARWYSMPMNYPSSESAPLSCVPNCALKFAVNQDPVQSIRCMPGVGVLKPTMSLST